MRIKSAHIALILSILALAVSLFTAVQVSRNDNAALIDALMAQNQHMQEQLDALGGQSGDLPGESELPAGVTLTAAALPDGSGADVTLTLDTDTGAETCLRVMLDNQVITEAPCVPVSGRLVATARISAQNGYSYSLIIGSEARTLASPENPVYPELVYLADALSAYCNLVVGESYVRDSVLTLESGFAQIHTPQLGDTAALAVTSARLVLKNRDTVLAETRISPVPDEASGGYACNIVDAAFTLPALAEGEEVELYLEATLSDGQVLSHCAATWYVMSGGFSMAAG